MIPADFAKSHRPTFPLIIEQDKSLGKGGLCWDAAFILGEYLIANYTNHAENVLPVIPGKTTNMIELGCGTGICGLLVATRLLASNHNVLVTMTNLPALLPLLQRNVAQNVCGDYHGILDEYMATRNYPPQPKVDGIGCTQSESNVKTSVLEWCDCVAEKRHGTFDIVFGADLRPGQAGAHDRSIVSFGNCGLH